MLHFSFSRFFFSGENYNRSPYFLCITSSFSVVDSDKTSSWITSSCLKFCWEKVEGILSIFSDELSSSGTVFILFSRSASINFFFWTPFFVFLQTFFLTRFLCIWNWVFNSTVESFVSPSIMFSSFMIFVLFRMLWMLVAVNKVNHMACHLSHTLQKQTSETLVTQIFLSVSNKKVS